MAIFYNNYECLIQKRIFRQFLLKNSSLRFIMKKMKFYFRIAADARSKKGHGQYSYGHKGYGHGHHYYGHKGHGHYSYGHKGYGHKG